MKQLLKILGGKGNKAAADPSATAAALAEVNAELERACQALASSEAVHDAGVVEALAVNDDATLVRLREGVDGARRRVELLQTTRAAVERRHQAAQEAQEARRIADQWERARKAADERRAALVKLAEALDAAADAINEANGAMARCVDLLPARLSYFPDGWPSHELAALVSMHLSARTNGAVRSPMPLSPFELAKQPGMVERHDRGAVEIFAAATTIAHEA